MTKSEAKDILQSIKLIIDREHYIDYVEEALDMAIKSLEAEPCEDSISRNTLEEAVSGLTYWHPTTDGRLEVGGAYDNTVYKVEDVWRLTRELPSVTPTHKTEQQPILDKIRAEIEQLRLHKAQFVTNDNKVCIDSQEVLNVIDKYTAESEE